MATFTIDVPRTYTFEEGWGVVVIPVHAGEDWTDEDAICDLDAELVRIAENTVVVRHGMPLIAIGGGWQTSYVPVKNFRAEDTGEYGDRWFATRAEAADYLAEVEQRGEAIRSWFD